MSSDRLPPQEQQESARPDREAALDAIVDEIFADSESRSNLVGLYNLLLQIDRRRDKL